MTDKNTSRKVLGRGLSALMADIEPAKTTKTSDVAKGMMSVPIDSIEPNPDQPRKKFLKDDLDDLAGSIVEKGIIQPLIVRKTDNKNNTYQIVAGERRWRAAQIARIHSIPVIVREFNDLEVLEVAIIENIQRSDLNPIDEARGYQQLMSRFSHTQEKLSKVLGKSRSHIANLLRLLTLPEDVQRMLSDDIISIGHARALITRNDASLLAREVVRRNLSVREVERLAKLDFKNKINKRVRKSKDADTRTMEADLKAATGLKFDIQHDDKTGKGLVNIKYNNLDQLDDVVSKLMK
ncbi:MAG: ParB/RepB/Spo0J family partition protein [Paracoccaceae bacterium]|nr:ParB/RepB/Spo0J family partition protein [Paracoccaceae bacterium]